MHKTTLYLPSEDIVRLKNMALRTSHKSLTHHIQKAIKLYLQLFQKTKNKKHRLLLKCRGTSKKSAFGDSVVFQRKLRDEWK